MEWGWVFQTCSEQTETFASAAPCLDHVCLPRCHSEFGKDRSSPVSVVEPDSIGFLNHLLPRNWLVMKVYIETIIHLQKSDQLNPKDKWEIHKDHSTKSLRKVFVSYDAGFRLLETNSLSWGFLMVGPCGTHGKNLSKCLFFWGSQTMSKYLTAHFMYTL